MAHRVRNALLGAAGAGLVATLYAYLVERAWIELDRHTVTVEKPGLPASGLVILHLTDLHCRQHDRVQARRFARLQRLLAGETYDLLALTGDLIHNEAGLPAALALIGSLSPRLGAYSCLGNHDYSEASVWGILEDVPAMQGETGWLAWRNLVAVAGNLIAFGRKVLRNERVHHPVATNDVAALNRALQARGVQPLVNRTVHLKGGGLDLWVGGVDDLNEGQPNLAAALSTVPPAALVLLLAHNPDAWLDPLAGRADVILSGHAHGGQVRLPLVGAIHTQGTHLSRRRPAGWFRRGATWMFASRGVGESLPLRFAARPQATLVRLVPGGQ